MDTASFSKHRFAAQFFSKLIRLILGLYNEPHWQQAIFMLENLFSYYCVFFLSLVLVSYDAAALCKVPLHITRSLASFSHTKEESSLALVTCKCLSISFWWSPSLYKFTYDMCIVIHVPLYVYVSIKHRAYIVNQRFSNRRQVAPQGSVSIQGKDFFLREEFGF